MADGLKVLKLRLEAQEELRDSIAFYRERAGEDWAILFKKRIADGLRAIATDPERYPSVKEMQGVQRLRIKQFPFSLLYINRGDYVWIIAIAHGSRRPGYWKQRVP